MRSNTALNRLGYRRTASRLGALSAVAMVWTLSACGASAPNQPEEAEPGLLRIGRKCELHGVRYSLDARFDLDGPTALALDTEASNDAMSRELVAGSYAITIRPDFSLWRDVAVAQLQVAAELVSDMEQRFEITPGESTLVAYEFELDGETAALDSD